MRTQRYVKHSGPASVSGKSADYYTNRLTALDVLGFVLFGALAVAALFIGLYVLIAVLVVISEVAS